MMKFYTKARSILQDGNRSNWWDERHRWTEAKNSIEARDIIMNNGFWKRNSKEIKATAPNRFEAKIITWFEIEVVLDPNGSKVKNGPISP
jgi:hypothetical protein